MALYGNTFLTGKELFFDESDVIVSKTDLKGKITYGNRIFLQLSQMGEAEVLGQPHNIIRHPEMPRCVYHFLWQEVQNKREIFAYVNNRAKSGDLKLHKSVMGMIRRANDTQLNDNLDKKAETRGQGGY